MKKALEKVNRSKETLGDMASKNIIKARVRRVMLLIRTLIMRRKASEAKIGRDAEAAAALVPDESERED